MDVRRRRLPVWLASEARRIELARLWDKVADLRKEMRALAEITLLLGKMPAPPLFRRCGSSMFRERLDW